MIRNIEADASSSILTVACGAVHLFAHFHWTAFQFSFRIARRCLHLNFYEMKFAFACSCGRWAHWLAQTDKYVKWRFCAAGKSLWHRPSERRMCRAPYAVMPFINLLLDLFGHLMFFMFVCIVFVRSIYDSGIRMTCGGTPVEILSFIVCAVCALSLSLPRMNWRWSAYIACRCFDVSIRAEYR